MRLLFDENLSFRLVRLLADLYPDSEHVVSAGLAAMDDGAIWRYAARNGMAIVTRDADFHQRASQLGPPPKVVWIRRGNCPTAEVARLLRDRHADIAAFGAHPTAALLILM